MAQNVLSYNEMRSQPCKISVLSTRTACKIIKSSTLMRKTTYMFILIVIILLLTVYSVFEPFHTGSESVSGVWTPDTYTLDGWKEKCVFSKTLELNEFTKDECAGKSRTSEAENVAEEDIFSWIRGIHEKMVTVEPSVQPLVFSCNKSVVSDVEDLLCMESPRFISTYKNPCWYSENDKFRCLPYFQLIGMGKCGSTDLFDRIAQHPDVLTNKGARGKETWWWSWRRYGFGFHKSLPRESFMQYLRYFRSDDIKRNPARNYITGDGTPMDLSDNSGWPYIPQNHGLREPRYITAHLIKHLNPHVRLIVILRDPIERSVLKGADVGVFVVSRGGGNREHVENHRPWMGDHYIAICRRLQDRLFSDYFFHGIGNMTTEAFHRQVLHSIGLLHNCTRKSTLRACLYDRNLIVSLTARLHIGFYAVFLQDWFQVFPRDQFIILKTEEYSMSVSKQLHNIYKFLDLRDIPVSTLETIARSSMQFETKRKQFVGQMKNDTRKILAELYMPFNEYLARLLNNSKYNWSA